MNRDKEVLEIYRRNIDITKKIKLLEDIELDITNEVEARDQNMQPDLHNELSEALRLTKDFLRELRSIDNHKKAS